MADTEPVGYCLEPHLYDKLRQVSAVLNQPYVLSYDQKRDLANLVDLIASSAMPITQADLQAFASAMP